MRHPAKKSDAPGAVELIEEAVHLLRSAPAAAWVIYLAGAVPWVLGLGYFWASASWFAPRPEAILWQALGLTALYMVLKVAQAEFCGRLRAVRFGVEPTPLGWRQLARTAARQARVQGWAVPLLALASLVVFPLGAVWMYFENATALAASPDADGESLERRARREAMRWPGPAHVAILLFTGVWLCVWLNIASTFYAVPWLARTMLGVENLFGLSGWSALNSTLLALVSILTWLAVDPLVKSYHVLRTFYGEARHTGEDLRLELRRPSAGGALVKAALFALAAIVLTGTGPGMLRAAETAAARITPAQVDGALDEALRDRDFRWSLQPLPSAQEAGEGDGVIKRFVRQGFDLIKQVVIEVRDFFERLGKWIDGWFKDKKEEEKPKPSEARTPTDFAALARPVLYALLCLCFLALVWILWTSWKRRPVAPRVLQPVTTVALPPDLNDEKLEASRLPSHEWLELARSQLARGEWRLALRALYLGSLANLASRGLVNLARAKTNLDYERELARRAAGRTEVVAGFRLRRLSFECVWYGRATAEERQVRAWLAELEREEGAQS
ncbi:MAG TPA: hypothetical protein VK985_15370 [Rariglobus sp.]|nr:hypothetical protein [Rariglobus sp.]